jgi:short-subunit dehydrogenase
VPRDLTDRVIVITGASSGIGAATAVACAAAGMDVVLTARRADRLREVAARVTALGRKSAEVAGDVTDAGLSERLLDTALDRFGRLDAVFANAGYGTTRLVVRETDEELRRMFDVNFFASVELLRLAAQRMIAARRPGHLLMCSSCLSKFSLPRHAAYAATKAAQNAVCSAMRLEVDRYGIHVSSVHPITTTTEFFDVSARESGITPPAGATPDHTPSFMVQPPERVARAIVKCLRRPVGEVWTSHITRTVAGVMTIFPRVGDWMLRRQTRREMAEETD